MAPAVSTICELSRAWELKSHLKTEYADEMGENVDVLVIGEDLLCYHTERRFLSGGGMTGGFYGKGRRGGKVSSLLCGLRDQQEDDGTLRRPT
jgi:DNA ligase-4